MYHKILHIDVNSAYLAWEAVWRLQHGEKLDLRTIPSIVGGDIKKRKGVVLARSMPARKFNIKTGESVYHAVKKCPHLVSVPPNFKIYKAASDALIELIKTYSPKVQRYSIDEAFLDYKGYEDSMIVAEKIRLHIKKELGFTVNIGVGDNKLLAKMASDFKKPDRVHRLYKEDIKTKMWPLPVGNLFMVGRKTEEKLNRRGIMTIGDLAKSEGRYIENWLKKPGRIIWEYAHGIENSPVSSKKRQAKSIGHSTTLAKDINIEKEILLILLALTESVGLRLRSSELYAGLVQVHYRNSNFENLTKEKSLQGATDSTSEIFNMVKILFKELWQKESIRQLGVRVGNLSYTQSMQLNFFEEQNLYIENFDQAIDQLRSKYGKKNIQRSTFLHSGIEPIIGGLEDDLDDPLMNIYF